VENPRLIVFDVDGTLLPGTSCERLFLSHLLQKRIIGLRNLISLGMRAIELMPKGWIHAVKANKGYLRGLSPDYMIGIGQEFFEDHVSKRISAKGISRIEEHRRDGDSVMLLSGMPEFLLLNFSEHLDADEYTGSVLEVNSDRFTGRTIGPFPLAEGKIEVLKPLLEKYRMEWSELTCYADHYLDRFLLEKVGHPVVVNPHYDLKRLAEQRGWPIESFD
jgi:putative phosphoserine phosphatase/1-acylglycerol-3-phosphate O-acyltransferase